MTDNVVRLASSNPRPRQGACSDCKYFHPDTNAFGWEGWSLFGFGPGRTPTAAAMKYATCSFSGGYYASVERASTCQGKNWTQK